MAGIDDVIRNIEEWEEEKLQAMYEEMERISSDMETAAKQGAPWRDGTGLARKGLMGYVDIVNPEKFQQVAADVSSELQTLKDAGRISKDAAVIIESIAEDGRVPVIILTGLMNYTEWLEVGRAGRYAIIVPTLESMIEDAIRRLQMVAEV